MAAIFIDMTSEDTVDPRVRVAEYALPIIKEKKSEKDAETFSNDFKELFGGEDFAGVFDLLIQQSPLLFDMIKETAVDRSVKEIKEREVEGYFTVLISLLQMLSEEEQLVNCTTKLCETFGDNEEFAELKLKMFMTLYNTFKPSFPLRYPVFKDTLKYAARTDLFDNLVPYLDRLDEWMAEWNLKAVQKREIYLTISDKMRKLGRKMEAFHWLKKLVVLYQGEPKDILSKDEAVNVSTFLAQDAITLPKVLQMDDILMLDAIQALKSTKSKGYVELIEIFVDKTVSELENFINKNKALFDGKDGLNREECFAKMRLLTIATLAQGRSELALGEVSKALKETDAGVEKWVVRAISEGIIEARIDQLRKMVLIKSSLQRKFGKPEWKFLADKLDTWINNLEALQALVSQQQPATTWGGS